MNPVWYHTLASLVFSTMAMRRIGAGMRRKKPKKPCILFLCCYVYIVAAFCLYESGFVFCYCFLGSKLSQLQNLYLPHIFFPFLSTTTDAFKLLDFIFKLYCFCFQACNHTLSNVVHFALHAFIILAFCPV